MPCTVYNIYFYEYVNICEIKHYITSEFYNSVQQNKCYNDHAADPNMTGFSPESSDHEHRTILKET